MVQMIGDALLQEAGSAHRAFGQAEQAGDLEASMVAAWHPLLASVTAILNDLLCHSRLDVTL